MCVCVFVCVRACVGACGRVCVGTCACGVRACVCVCVWNFASHMVLCGGLSSNEYTDLKLPG